MSRFRLYFVGVPIACLSLCMASCTAFSRGQGDERGVRIPSYIHEPHQQLQYYINHYWSSIPISDSLWLSKSESLESYFIDYLALLANLDKPQAGLITSQLNSLDGEKLLTALGYYRRHLYELDSPLHNEELYRAVLLWAIKSPKVPSEHQEVARELLKVLERNRVGKVATDFVYETDSTTHRLHPIAEPYRLLIFHTADCPSCRELYDYMERTPIFERLREQGRLRIQIIYVQHGGDRTILKADTLLPKWVERTIDPSDSIVSHQLYDLRSSPTLYLLSRGGKVVLKDPKLEELSKYLVNHGKQ